MSNSIVDGVFARLGQNVELVGTGAADGAVVRFNRTEVQALAQRIQADIEQRFAVQLEMEPNLY